MDEVLELKGGAETIAGIILGSVTEAIKSGKPCVINTIVQGGKEVLADPFRKDALEMPKRYLKKYEHLNLS